jgi:peptide/nickel transport system permease protein
VGPNRGSDSTFIFGSWGNSSTSDYLWRALLRTWTGRIGLTIVALNIIVFLLGPFVAPYDPTATGIGIPATGPAAEHLLGTDSLGRDVLSRLLSGGGEVVLLPLAAVALAFLFGGSAGMIAGYIGGWLDAVVMAITNILLSIPSLLLALVIIAGFGASDLTVILTVAVVYMSRATRMLRSAVRLIRRREYVEAAESAGESSTGIVLYEILPNITGPFVVEFSVRFTYAVIFVTSLSFLGLGAQPPSSNWGLMIAESRGILSANPSAALAPALTTACLIVGVILIADTLANALQRESLSVSD